MIKKKGIIALIFAVLFLLVVLANTITAPTPATPWYQVEDWEKEVCSKWGGTQFSGQAVVTMGRKLSFGSLSATMQAKKFRTPENYYLYEVGWYIDSFAEDMDYDVIMLDPEKPDVFRRVVSGRLVPDAGTSGFETYNLTQDFTHLRFKYTGGEMLIPIIRVK